MTENIDIIRDQIRMLDRLESLGENVTTVRTYWCNKAVAWAKERLQDDILETKGASQIT